MEAKTMAKKSATKKVRTMIVGSEGHEDYLVIARQNGYVLGIKPLLMISSDEAQFGFRLRMQKAQTTEDISKVPEAETQSMLQTFPEIPWSKRNATRFSTMLLRPSSFGWDFRKEIIKDAKKSLAEMVKDVKAKIEPIKLFDEKDVMKFLTDGFTGIIELIETSIEKNDNKPDKKNGTAEIVAFPGTGEGDPADI
jgi:hypothetical protein